MLLSEACVVVPTTSFRSSPPPRRFFSRFSEEMLARFIVLAWPFFSLFAFGLDGVMSCSGGVSDGSIKKAFRKIAKDVHPDLSGQESSSVGDFAELKDGWIRDPMRFHIFRAIHGRSSKLQPLGATIGKLSNASVKIERRSTYQDESAFVSGNQINSTAWPYFVVTADFDNTGGELNQNSRYSFAFSKKGLSTVHYRGMDGYDVCCDFVADSKCARSPADVVARGGDAYITSDCPVDNGLVKFRVAKPLHVDEAGQWGVALRVLDGNGTDFVCAAFAVTVEADPRARNKEQSESFVLVKQAAFCEDGGDILEGAVDQYGVDSHFSANEFSSFYGGKCREKCQKRVRCRFFTVYSSGWCQLSTKCGKLRKHVDPLVLTYVKGEAKVEIIEEDSEL